jgi:molybdenum cofactor guanylyltransferase
MGCDKASLPVGGQSMLARTVATLAEVVWPIVIVAAEGQSLPVLDREVEIVRDRRPDRGPLEGIATGLAALAGKVDAAYVTAVDVPLLQSRFVAAVLDRLDDEAEVVLPCDWEHHHTLAAVYRPRVLPTLERLLEAGERRPAALFAAARVRRIDVEQLRSADPELLSLTSCNRPQQYREALIRLGIDPEEPR